MILFSDILNAVQAGQGLTAEQALLLKAYEECIASLKFRWKLEERESRTRRKARKLLDVQVARLKGNGLEGTAIGVAAARDLLDHRKNNPRR